MRKIRDPQKIKKTAIRVAIAAFWLFVWQCLYWIVGMPLYLESPWHALQALDTLFPTMEFWAAVLSSLLHILLGLLIGCITGGLLAMLTSRFKFLDALFRPILTLVKTIPVVSFIMLLWLTFFRHRGFMPIIISALMVFPIMWAEVTNGYQTIDRQLEEMGRCFANRRDNFLYIRLPHMFPYILSGVTTSVGLAWKAGVAAEVICRPDSSIGKEIYSAREGLDSDLMFAWTAVIVVLSILLERILVRGLKQIEFRPKLRRNDDFADNGSSFPLQFDAVAARYGDKEVLRDFSYSFPNGKVIAILGKSGCGKTTLLRIAAGLMQPSKGSYELPPTSAGIIFQENRLIPTLTVEENILFANHGANIGQILKDLYLTKEAKRYPRELSGGMQRRVAIGRAIAFYGGIGIFDEPFTGLDGLTKELCAKALFDMYRGRTVLFVTHSVEEAARYADEILELEDIL